MGRDTWLATVHGVTNSQPWLNIHTHCFPDRPWGRIGNHQMSFLQRWVFPFSKPAPQSVFSLILLPVILMNTWWEKRIVVLVQFFSCSVVSDSLRPHGLQHTRPPCPSSTPKVYSNSCPLSWWCHPTISSSVVPFFSCPQSFPASGSFQMSQFFPSGSQSIEVSPSTPVTPMNTQDWSPLGWTHWISFQSKGLSRVFSNTTVQKHQFFSSKLSSQSNSHIHTWLLEKP